MNTNFNNVSDEQLNALLDNELETDEEVQLIEAIDANAELQQRFEALRKTKSLYVQAYEEVPVPLLPPQKANWKAYPGTIGIAVSIVLCVGIYLGWLAEPLMPHNVVYHETPGLIRSVAEIDPKLPQSNTILL